MAKNYNDIYTAVYTKGNKMDFTNSMIRGNGIPLDITDVYNSYAAAKNYVDSNPVAYEGQVLAVTENNDTTVYVIAARLAADGEKVEHYLKPVGSVPEVDGETIIINSEGQLEAVLPEYVDTNTTYTLTTEEVEEGTQLIFTSSDEEVENVIVLIPKAYDDSTLVEELEKKANSDDVYSIEEINDLLDEKADKATTLEGYGITDAYTKTETDTKIGEAVAAADHLKRKIVETKEAIDVKLPDAMQYIYMVPVGTRNDDNKYREYIVLEDKDGVRFIEQVGNWEVDLSGYLTEANAEKFYATAERVSELEDKASQKADRVDVYSISEADNKFIDNTELTTTLEDYVTEQELSTTLNGYATKEEIPTDYVSEEKFAIEMAKYETAEIAQEKYADKTATEQAIDTLDSAVSNLQKVGAEKNIIATVSSDFNVTQNRELELVSVPQNIVGGLSKTTWSMDENGEFLATTTEATLSEILVPANFDETDGKGQSGLMTAEQAQKLSALVIGEGGIEISGKVNAENVEGLSAWVTNNRDKVPGLYPTAAVTLLNDLDTAINHKETGLIAGLTAVEARVLTNENSIKDHADRLDALEYAMTWHELDQNSI